MRMWLNQLPNKVLPVFTLVCAVHVWAIGPRGQPYVVNSRPASASALEADVCNAQASAQELKKGELVGMLGPAVYADGVFMNLGAATGYFLSKRLAVVGEFHRVGAEKQETFYGIRVQMNSSELALLGGVHILFPQRSGKVEPYISAGAGLRHTASEGTGSARGMTVRARSSETSPALFCGGGIRLFGSTRWGIRPEVKLVLSGGFRLLGSVGFFYRFK